MSLVKKILDKQRAELFKEEQDLSFLNKTTQDHYFTEKEKAIDFLKTCTAKKIKIILVE